MSSEANFHSYVVCPKCHAMYDLKAYSELQLVLRSPKCASTLNFPTSQTSKRNKCGTDLLQKVKVGGKYKMKPFKVYRPGFLKKCEEWRRRESTDDSLTDMFDGQ